MAAAFNLTAQINLRGPTNTRAIASSIRKQLSNIKVKVDLDLKGSSSKSIASVNKGLQNISTNAARANANINQLNSNIQRLATSLGGLGTSGPQTLAATGKAANSAGKSITTATTQMQEFGKQSGLAIRRFAAFSTVTGVIYGLTNAIGSAYKEFINFDKEIVRLSQVTGTSVSGLAGITSEITKLSTNLGVASTDLLQVSVTLAQAGLSAQDTKTALEALAKSALAPSFDDLNSTVEGSIALMRQFNISTGELEGALGSINAVAAAFAVEASDIITAIQRTGGVFASASNGISQGTDALNEFVALFTSVRQTTRESAETIATGLRTIFTRIQRGTTIEALKEYGVVLTDLEGKFVGPYEAVRRLSEGLAGLDPRDLRFSKIVEELGGFRQIGKVIPLIQQFATAENALSVAQRGQSSLTKNALEAQKSLAVQFEKTRQAFVALIRDIGNSSTFRTVATISLTTANAFISLASALKPLLPMLTALAAIKGASILSEFSSGFFGGIGGGGAKGGGGPAGPRGGGGGTRGGGGASASNSKAVTANTQAISANTTQLSAVNNTLSGMINSLNTLSQAISALSLSGPATANSGGRIMHFAKGGSVPGSGRGDKISAVLEPGEFVMNRNAVQAYGRGNLIKLNKYRAGSKVKPGVQKLVQIAPSSDTEFTHLDTRLEASDFPADFQSYLKKTKETSKVKALYSSMGLDLPRTWNQDWRTPSNYAGTFSDKLSAYISGNNIFKTLLGKKKESSASAKYGFEGRSESIAYSLLVDAQDTIKNNLASLISSGSKKFYDTDSADVATTLPGLLEKSVKTSLPRAKSAELISALKTKIAYEGPSGRQRTNTGMRSAFGSAKKYFGGLIQKFAKGEEATIDPGIFKPYGKIGEIAKQKLESSQGDLSPQESLLKTIEEQIIALGRISGISGIIGANTKYGPLTKVMRIDAIRQGRTSLETASNILNQALGTKGSNDAAEEVRLKKLTKVGIAGLMPIGYSKDKEWKLEGGRSVFANIRGVSQKYLSAVQQMQAETASSAQRLAENMQYSDIFSGDRLALDFDETLVSGADILDGSGKPDLPKYSDRDIVQKALKQGRLTKLGVKLKSLIDNDPSFIKNTRILTARPQSTVDLLAKALQSFGLPYSTSDITGVSQGLGTDIAKAKAQNLAEYEKLIDDNLDNVMSAKKSGKKAFLYTEPRAQPALDELIGQGNIEGAVVEKALALLGANLPPIDQMEANRAIDFPGGLGRASQFFDLDPNIPTEVKRTLNGSSFDKARSEFERYFNENPDKYNLGGLVSRFAIGGRSTKNIKRGSRGPRGFSPMDPKDYASFADQAYSEAGPYGSSGWGEHSGVPMPKPLADYAKKLQQWVFESGGAGISLGKKLVKIPDNIEPDALEALKPDLIQQYDGWYAEIEEILPFGKARLSQSPAASAKEARALAAMGAEQRNKAYTQAEEAIGLFKKTGQLSLDPGIDQHIRNSFPSYISDLENELKSATDPDEKTSIQRKLSKAQKAWPDYQALSKGTQVPNQGRITALSETLYSLLDQYGSGEVSNAEIDNIIKSLAQKLPTKKFAGGGPVSLYHGSNTGTNDSVLESFKKNGAKSDIAQGYGQGAGFYVYSGKEKAKQQAMMRVKKGLGSFAVVSGDTEGKPMVVTFREFLDPATWDLDYELNKGSVVKWLVDNYDQIKDKIAPSDKITGISDIIKQDRSQGIMSSGIKVQSDTGSRKTIYSGTDSDLREGELVGQIMNRLQSKDPKIVHDFENQFFQSPSLASGDWDNLALKYVGSSPLKPVSIETFARGGSIGNFASGGTVNALLTPGEAVIGPKTAQKIGYGKLSKMNHADKNGMTGYAGGGDVRIVPGSGNSDTFGPVPLPVGSFVIRKKATKALGLNKGGAVGSVRRFATGGGVDADRMDYLSKIAQKLGITIQQYERSIRGQILKRAQTGVQEKTTAQTDIQKTLIKNLDSIGDADVEKTTREELTSLFRKIDPNIDDTEIAKSVDEVVQGMKNGLSISDLKNTSDGLKNILDKNITILSELGDAHADMEKELGFLTGKMRVRGIDVKAQKSLKEGKFGALETANLRQAQRNLESPTGKVLDRLGSANQTSNIPGMKSLERSFPAVADKLTKMGDKVGGITGIIGIGASQLSAQMPKILSTIDQFANTVSETSPAVAGLQGALRDAGSLGLSGAIVGKQTFGNKGAAVGGALGLAGGAASGFIKESTAKEVEMSMRGVSAASNTLGKTLSELANARTLGERQDLQERAAQNYQALNAALEQSAKTIKDNRIWNALSSGLEGFLSTLITVMGMMAAAQMGAAAGGGGGRRGSRPRPRKASGGRVGLATGGLVPVKLASGEGVFTPPLPASQKELDNMNQADRTGYSPSFGGEIGIVPGSGSGKVDNFDTMLPEGSYVIRTDAMKAMAEQKIFAAKGGGIGRYGLSSGGSTNPLAIRGGVKRYGLGGLVLPALKALGSQIISIGKYVAPAVAVAVYDAFSGFFDPTAQQAQLQAQLAALDQLRKIADNSNAFAVGNKGFAERVMTLSEPIEKASMTSDQRRSAYGRSRDATGGLNPLNILQEQEARSALGAEGMRVSETQSVQEYLDTLGDGTEARKKADAAVVKAQERLRKRIYLEARQREGADVNMAGREYDAAFSADGKTRDAKAAENVNRLVDRELGGENRAKVLAARLEIVNRSVRKFTLDITDVMNRLSSNMTRIVGEIGASADRAMNISGEFSGSGARANESDSENLRVLENISAYSRQELATAVDSISQSLGDNDQTKQMGDMVKGLQVIQQELPLILRDTAGGDIGAGAESNIRSRLTKMFGGLDMSPEIRRQLEDNVMEWVNASTTMNRQGMTMEDLAGDVTAFKELSDAAEKARQTLEDYARKQLEVNRRLGAMSDQLAASFDKLADNAVRVQDIQLQAALQLKEKFGQTTSLQEMNAPFESSIAGLTGGIVDPIAIGREISNAIAEKRNLESDPGKATSALGSGEIAKLTSKINRYQRALDVLATSTDRASSALRKIDEQSQISAGRRRSVMDFFSMLDNPESMMNFVKESNSYGRVMGGAGGTGDIKGAISTLQSLEGSKSTEEFANLQKQLFDNITRILSNSGADPAVFDRFRDMFSADFGKPQDNPQIKPYIDAFNQAAEIQTTAVKTQSNLISEGGQLLSNALSLAADNFTSKMKTAIDSIVAELNGVANRLGLGGASAPGKARGGLIGYYSMGDMVNFAPKGTDTVPAMLTPGEFVVNRSATSKHLPLLQSINSGKYSSGGQVRYLAGGGLLDRSVKSRFPVVPDSEWEKLAGSSNSIPLSGFPQSDLLKYVDYRSSNRDNVLQKSELSEYNDVVQSHYSRLLSSSANDRYNKLIQNDKLIKQLEQDKGSAGGLFGTKPGFLTGGDQEKYKKIDSELKRARAWRKEELKGAQNIEWYQAYEAAHAIPFMKRQIGGRNTLEENYFGGDRNFPFTPEFIKTDNAYRMSRLGLEPPDFESFMYGLGSKVFPGILGVIGGGLGLAVGAFGGPVGGFAGAIGGGFAGDYAGQKINEYLWNNWIPQSVKDRVEAQKEKYPKSYSSGQWVGFASEIAAGSFADDAIVKGSKAAFRKISAAGSDVLTSGAKGLTKPAVLSNNVIPIANSEEISRRAMGLFANAPQEILEKSRRIPGGIQDDVAALGADSAAKKSDDVTKAAGEASDFQRWINNSANIKRIMEMATQKGEALKNSFNQSVGSNMDQGMKNFLSLIGIKPPEESFLAEFLPGMVEVSGGWKNKASDLFGALGFFRGSDVGGKGLIKLRDNVSLNVLYHEMTHKMFKTVRKHGEKRWKDYQNNVHRMFMEPKGVLAQAIDGLNAAKKTPYSGADMVFGSYYKMRKLRASANKSPEMMKRYIDAYPELAPYLKSNTKVTNMDPAFWNIVDGALIRPGGATQAEIATLSGNGAEEFLTSLIHNADSLSNLQREHLGKMLDSLLDGLNVTVNTSKGSKAVRFARDNSVLESLNTQTVFEQLKFNWLRPFKGIIRGGSKATDTLPPTAKTPDIIPSKPDIRPGPQGPFRPPKGPDVGTPRPKPTSPKPTSPPSTTGGTGGGTGRSWSDFVSQKLGQLWEGSRKTGEGMKSWWEKLPKWARSGIGLGLLAFEAINIGSDIWNWATGTSASPPTTGPAGSTTPTGGPLPPVSFGDDPIEDIKYAAELAKRNFETTNATRMEAFTSADNRYRFGQVVSATRGLGLLDPMGVTDFRVRAATIPEYEAGMGGSDKDLLTSKQRADKEQELKDLDQQIKEAGNYDLDNDPNMRTIVGRRDELRRELRGDYRAQVGLGVPTAKDGKPPQFTVTSPRIPSVEDFGFKQDDTYEGLSIFDSSGRPSIDAVRLAKSNKPLKDFTKLEEQLAIINSPLTEATTDPKTGKEIKGLTQQDKDNAQAKIATMVKEYGISGANPEEQQTNLIKHLRDKSSKARRIDSADRSWTNFDKNVANYNQQLEKYWIIRARYENRDQLKDDPLARMVGSPSLSESDRDAKLKQVREIDDKIRELQAKPGVPSTEPEIKQKITDKQKILDELYAGQSVTFEKVPSLDYLLFNSPMDRGHINPFRDPGDLFAYGKPGTTNISDATRFATDTNSVIQTLLDTYGRAFGIAGPVPKTNDEFKKWISGIKPNQATSLPSVSANKNWGLDKLENMYNLAGVGDSDVSENWAAKFGLWSFNNEENAFDNNFIKNYRDAFLQKASEYLKTESSRKSQEQVTLPKNTANYSKAIDAIASYTSRMDRGIYRKVNPAFGPLRIDKTAKGATEEEKAKNLARNISKGYIQWKRPNIDKAFAGIEPSNLERWRKADQRYNFPGDAEQVRSTVLADVNTLEKLKKLDTFAIDSVLGGAGPAQIRELTGAANLLSASNTSIGDAAATGFTDISGNQQSGETKLVDFLVNALNFETPHNVMDRQSRFKFVIDKDLSANLKDKIYAQYENQLDTNLATLSDAYVLWDSLKNYSISPTDRMPTINSIDAASGMLQQTIGGVGKTIRLGKKDISADSGFVSNYTNAFGEYKDEYHKVRTAIGYLSPYAKNVNDIITPFDNPEQIMRKKMVDIQSVNAKDIKPMEATAPASTPSSSSSSLGSDVKTKIKEAHQTVQAKASIIFGDQALQVKEADEYTPLLDQLGRLLSVNIPSFNDRSASEGKAWSNYKSFYSGMTRFGDLIDSSAVAANLPQINQERLLREQLDKIIQPKYLATGGQAIVNYQPRGTDTIPAMLTRGEYVVNKQATAKNLPLLNAINNGNVSAARSIGGVSYARSGGVINPIYRATGGAANVMGMAQSFAKGLGIDISSVSSVFDSFIRSFSTETSNFGSLINNLARVFPALNGPVNAFGMHVDKLVKTLNELKTIEIKGPNIPETIRVNSDTIRVELIAPQDSNYRLTDEDRAKITSSLEARLKTLTTLGR